MKCGTSAKLARSGPISTGELGSYSSTAKACSISVLVAPGADDVAKRLGAPGRRDQPGARRRVGAGVAGDRDRLLARGSSSA